MNLLLFVGILDLMQLWLNLSLVLARVWQVAQDSLLMVLASTLQLWLTLDLPLM